MSSGPKIITVDKSKIFINELGQTVIDDVDVSRALKPYIDNLESMTSLFTLLKKDGCGGGAVPPIHSLCHCDGVNDQIRVDTF